jgi:hypothetical protein
MPAGCHYPEQEIIDLDLDTLAEIRPPRGFGRD